MKERHPVKAVMSGILHFVIFVALIWLGVSMLLEMEPEMAFLFNDTVYYAMILGTPLAIVAALGAYFHPGEPHRLIFGLSHTGVAAAYFFFLFGSLDLGWHGDEFVYSISMTGIFMLIILLMILKGGYNITEYVLLRDKKTVAQEDSVEELLNRAKELKQEGWQVDNLIHTIKTKPEEGHRALSWYEERIDLLRGIKDMYDSLDVHELDLNTGKLERDLTDPHNDPEELRSRVNKLADHVNSEMTDKI